MEPPWASQHLPPLLRSAVSLPHPYSWHCVGRAQGANPTFPRKHLSKFPKLSLQSVGSCFPLGLPGSRRVAPSSDPAEWLSDHPVPIQGNETHLRPRWAPMGKAQRLPARGGGHRGKEGAAPWGARATPPPSQDGYQLPHREANRRGHGFAFWGMFFPRKSGGVGIVV